MPRTQIRREDIGNHEITGASINLAMGIYDETTSYNIDDIVVWKTDTWVATDTIPSTIEGDLQYAPETNTNWVKITPIHFGVYPTSSQTFQDTDTVLALDTTRSTDIFNRVTLNTTDYYLDFNATGEMIFTFEYTAESGTTTRSTSYAWLESSTDGTTWTQIQNSKVYCYHRTTNNGATTGSVTFPYSITTGDKIRCVMTATSANDIKTIPSACNLTVFTTMGTSGPKGDKGDVGPSGDINWTGAWSSSNTYDENDAVEYLGSSYVSTANGNTETPSDTASDWDIIAKRGNDGSGSTIIVSEEGTDIPNTPHSTLNFTGDIITASDAGSGVATINITPKYEYIMPIWAEENGGLNDDSYEWAFGNGANTPLAHGVVLYVPSGYSAEVVALGLIVNSSSNDAVAEVRCEITDGTGTMRVAGSVTVDIPTTSNIKNIVELSSPEPFVNGEAINFKTVSISGSSSGPNVVTAYLKYKQN